MSCPGYSLTGLSASPALHIVHFHISSVFRLKYWVTIRSDFSLDITQSLRDCPVLSTVDERHLLISHFPELSLVFSRHLLADKGWRHTIRVAGIGPLPVSPPRDHSR